MGEQENFFEAISKISVATSSLKEFSGDDLETIYIAAYKHYHQGSYVKACELFLQLTRANPYEAAFWKALASCYQMQNMWEQALHSWALCALLDSKDPYTHYHAAECLHAQKNTDQAKKALAKAKEFLTFSKDDILLKKIDLLENLCI